MQRRGKVDSDTKKSHISRQLGSKSNEGNVVFNLYKMRCLTNLRLHSSDDAIGTDDGESDDESYDISSSPDVSEQHHQQLLEPTAKPTNQPITPVYASNPIDKLYLMQDAYFTQI